MVHMSPLFFAKGLCASHEIRRVFGEQSSESFDAFIERFHSVPHYPLSAVFIGCETRSPNTGSSDHLLVTSSESLKPNFTGVSRESFVKVPNLANLLNKAHDAKTNIVQGRQFKRMQKVIPRLRTEGEIVRQNAIEAFGHLTVHPAIRCYMQTTMGPILLIVAFRASRSFSLCLGLFASDSTAVIFQGDYNKITIGDSGTVVELAPSVHRPLDFFGDVAPLPPKNAEVPIWLSVINENSNYDCDLHKLFELLNNFVQDKNIPGAKKMSKRILDNVRNDIEEQKRILSDESMLDSLREAFVSFVDDNEFAALTFDILVELSRYGVEKERHLLKVMWKFCVNTSLWIGFAKSLRNALDFHNGELFAKQCRLHILVSQSEYQMLALSNIAKQMSDGMVHGMMTSLQALNVFAEEPHVVAEIILFTYHALSLADASAAKFYELDGVSVITGLMCSLRDEQVSTAGCKLLNAVARETFLTAPEFQKGVGVISQAMLDSITWFGGYTELVEAACSLLIKVALLSPKHVEKLMQAGAPARLSELQLKHAGNGSVESLTNQLLLVLDAEADINDSHDPRQVDNHCERSRSRRTGNARNARTRAERSRTAVQARMSHRSTRNDRAPSAHVRKLHAPNSSVKALSVEPPKNNPNSGLLENDK